MAGYLRVLMNSYGGLVKREVKQERLNNRKKGETVTLADRKVIFQDLNGTFLI